MERERAERIIKRIIQEFKAIRLSKGMSHENLAKKTGITRPAISHIENGKRKPSLLVSLKIAAALDKDLSEVIREAEKKESSE